MKSFIGAIVATVIVAVGAMYALDFQIQQRADSAFALAHSVRLPEHGNIHNLVGKTWLNARDHDNALHWTGTQTEGHRPAGN